MSVKKILVSGGFDPIHPGHIRMMAEAYAIYGHVVVVLNSDDWLIRKKGYFFFNYIWRREILLGLRCVNEVTAVDDRDGTVCEALHRIRPDYFGNGGDRGPANTPELEVCRKLGIEPIFNLGGGKLVSSSDSFNQAMAMLASKAVKVPGAQAV